MKTLFINSKKLKGLIMNIRKITNISEALLIIGALSIFLLYAVPEGGILYGIIFLFSATSISVGIYLKFKYYRCPHCHSLLPLRTFSFPTFCPGCGKKIE
ncbi:MAG: zinc ribbon domain-containing protein [Sphingobacteriia bacterium]|nr:zinc ribbon domain-containing protein [Sphingobacteriia bacterium]